MSADNLQSEPQSNLAERSGMGEDYDQASWWCAIAKHRNHRCDTLPRDILQQTVVAAVSTKQSKKGRDISVIKVKKNYQVKQC